MAISDMIRKEASLPSGDLRTVMTIVREFVHDWLANKSLSERKKITALVLPYAAKNVLPHLLNDFKKVFANEISCEKYTHPYKSQFPNIREEVIEMLPIPRIAQYFEVCLSNEIEHYQDLYTEWLKKNVRSSQSMVAPIQNLAEEIKTSAGSIGKPLTGPPPKNRNPVVQGLIERGGAGAGYHADSNKKKDTRRDRQDTKKKIRQNLMGD